MDVRLAGERAWGSRYAARPRAAPGFPLVALLRATDGRLRRYNRVRQGWRSRAGPVAQPLHPRETTRHCSPNTHRPGCPGNRTCRPDSARFARRSGARRPISRDPIPSTLHRDRTESEAHRAPTPYTRRYRSACLAGARRRADRWLGRRNSAPVPRKHRSPGFREAALTYGWVFRYWPADPAAAPTSQISFWPPACKCHFHAGRYDRQS